MQNHKACIFLREMNDLNKIPLFMSKNHTVFSCFLNINQHIKREASEISKLNKRYCQLHQIKNNLN